MSPISPVYYTTPDGVQRTIRWTFGAKKRVSERFKMPLADVLKQYDASAIADILYCCMFDDANGGKPPDGLDPNWAADLGASADAEQEMFAVFMQAQFAAAGKPVPEKNVLMGLIEQAIRIGSGFGVSLESGSALAPLSSGPAQTESSNPSPSSTVSASEPETSAPA